MNNWKPALALLIALTAACNSSKEDNFKKGSDLYGKGDFKGAIVHLRSAVENDPNYFEARYLLGKLYLDTSRFDQADVELNKVALQSPDYQDIHYELARLFVNTKRYDEAITQAKAHLAKTPNDSKALEIIARSLAILKNPAEAEKYFDQALKASPDNVEAKINFARFNLSLGNIDKSRALLNDAIARNPKETAAYFLLADIESSQGQYKKALETYERYLALFPSDQEALYRSGVLYFQMNDLARLDAAKEAMQKLQGKEENPDAALLGGLSAFAKNQYAEAIAMLQKSTSKKSRIIGEYILGQSHFRQKEYEQALNRFQGCLDAYPEASQPRMMVAVTLMSQKRLPDALSAVEQLLSKDPGNQDAHSLKGDILAGMGRLDQALQSYELAAQSGETGAMARYKMGMVRFGKGDEARGESELETSLRIDPGLIQSRVSLAAVHIRNKKFDEAIALLKKGLNGTQKDALLHSFISQAYLSQGKAKEAKQSLEEAQRIAPDFVDPYLNLASIYAAEGNSTKTLAELEKAMSVVPDNTRLMVTTAQLADMIGNDNKAVELLEKAKNANKDEGYKPMVSYQLSHGKPEEALATVNEALAKTPENLAALEDKGKLLSKMGRFDEASEVFLKLAGADKLKAAPLLVGNHISAKKFDEALSVAKEAVSVKQDSPVGYLLVAITLRDAGKPREALESIDRVPFSVAGDEKIQLMKASLMEAVGDARGATQVYETLIKQYPNSSEAQFNLAVLYDFAGDWKKAEGLYRDVVSKNPNNSFALNNLAFLYAEYMNRPDEALVLAIKAYRNMGDNPAILDTLGYVLYKKGDYAKAREVLEMALSHKKRNPSMLYHLGMVYKALGDKEKAVATLEEARAGGNFAEKDKVVDALKALRN